MVIVGVEDVATWMEGKFLLQSYDSKHLSSDTGVKYRTYSADTKDESSASLGIIAVAV